jgi:hypothetical protein
MAQRHGLIVQVARPEAPFALTPSDLVTLQSWLRMGSLAQNLAQRARILLLLADGLTPNTVAEQMQGNRPNYTALHLRPSSPLTID